MREECAGQASLRAPRRPRSKQKDLRGTTVSEPALEQQKQNHLRPWSRRLTAEEEKNKRVRKPESHRNNKSWYTHLLRDF
jgi:hypothetical protein